VTKTWAKPPVPFLVNLGWKATNAAIFGIGGQATRFADGCTAGWEFRCYWEGTGGCAFGRLHTGATTVKGLALPANGIPFVAGKADLPTTLDYAIRVTQRNIRTSHSISESTVREYRSIQPDFLHLIPPPSR